MKISDVAVPQVYKEESADFRFFLKWFETALTKVHYDTENLPDIYDPLKCPDWLLWMLADTMGYKYDDRLPTSFNRLVLVYFMSMIRNRGSKDGVTLAAEVNLKQFDIETVAGIGYEDKNGEFVPPKDILFNRLEDTSIPVNSVYVTPHTPEGYIDVVYFSDRIPTDACIEYVRPLGMYMLQHAGVRMDSRTKISVDARLTDDEDVGLSIGPTHVGHYSREDYARLQKLVEDDLTRDRSTQSKDSERRRSAVKDTEHLQWRDKATRTARIPKGDLSHTRRNVWYRNADYEGGLDSKPVQGPNRKINPGYRAMYSLQLCNNEHIVKSLIPSKPGEPLDDQELREKDQIFGLGWRPQDVTTRYPDDFVLPDEEYEPVPVAGLKHGRIRAWNLRYDKAREEAESADVWTIEDDRSRSVIEPRPAVNPVMKVIGDAISMNSENTQYVVATGPNGEYPPAPSRIQKDGQDTVEIQDGELAVYRVEPDGRITTKVTDVDDIVKD